jgi:GTPase SAR1 family protein
MSEPTSTDLPQVPQIPENKATEPTVSTPKGKTEAAKKDTKKEPTKKVEEKPKTEEKKKGPSHEDLIKAATNFPVPDDSMLYQTEVAVQKNVLIVGKAGVGKTTLFEVLKNPGHKTSTSYSFFASGPKEASYTPLVVRNGSGKAYSINVIDTPGICEIRATMAERSSNEQIMKIIQDCVNDKVTHLSAVFLLVPIGIINEEDIQVLNTMKTLLGDAFKRNTMLVFTHAEQHQLTTLTDRLKEFLSSEISLPFLEFCQGGVHFSGALNGELCQELGHDYENKVKTKVICLRQNILESIVNSSDVKVDFNTSSTPVAEGDHKSHRITTTPSKRGVTNDVKKPDAK